MKISLLLVFLFLCACANAAQHSANAAGPEFLEPTDPLDFNSPYLDRINKKLCVTNADYGRVIFLDCWSGESSISVYGTQHAGSRPGAFRITLLKAQRSLWVRWSWRDMPFWLVPVKRTDVDIDRQLAEAVRSAWIAMLKRTRVPRPNEHLPADEPARLGDYPAQFSVTTPQGKILLGTDYDSLENTLADEMVQIGYALDEYTSASQGARPALREKLLSQLRRFEKRVNQT